MKLQVLGDVVTIMVGVLVLAVFGWRYFPDSTPPLESAVDVRLDSSIGIDFATADLTLMVLQSDCGFCQESMSFYRRLTTVDTPDLQVVVAAPVGDTGISDQLMSESVYPDSIVFVSGGTLPVSGTPTLLLVDSEGLVTHSWIGLLDEAGEVDVLRALSG